MSHEHLLKRIDERLKAMGLSDRKASLKAGLGPDGIRTMRKGHAPRASRLAALAQVLDVPASDLLGLAEESGLVVQDDLIREESNVSASHAAQTESSNITEIDVRAGMGGGGEALALVDEANGWAKDALAGEWAMPTDYLRGELRVHPQSVKLISVVGDSMTPTLHSDDRVMVNLADKTPSPGGVFALWDGLGVVVKRLQYIPHSDPPTVQIISDNPAHPMFERTLEEINVIGRVVWFARRL